MAEAWRRHEPFGFMGLDFRVELNHERIFEKKMLKTLDWIFCLKKLLILFIIVTKAVKLMEFFYLILTE